MSTFDTEIDLDAVTTTRTGIHKMVVGPDGALERRTWDLRDDIPVETLFRVFRMRTRALQEQQAQQQQRAGMAEADYTPEMVEAQFAAVERGIEEVADILLAIFQHSYPETTSDELHAWFSHEERLRLVNLFFTRRWSALQALSSDSTDDSTPSPTPANRATRRQTNGSGAIPSQKRIRQALQGL